MIEIEIDPTEWDQDSSQDSSDEVIEIDPTEWGV